MLIQNFGLNILIISVQLCHLAKGFRLFNTLTKGELQPLTALANVSTHRQLCHTSLLLVPTQQRVGLPSYSISVTPAGNVLWNQRRSIRDNAQEQPRMSGSLRILLITSLFPPSSHVGGTQKLKFHLLTVAILDKLNSPLAHFTLGAYLEDSCESQCIYI